MTKDQLYMIELAVEFGYAWSEKGKSLTQAKMDIIRLLADGRQELERQVDEMLKGRERGGGR